MTSRPVRVFEDDKGKLYIRNKKGKKTYIRTHLTKDAVQKNFIREWKQMKKEKGKIKKTRTKNPKKLYTTKNVMKPSKDDTKFSSDVRQQQPIPQSKLPPQIGQPEQLILTPALKGKESVEEMEKIVRRLLPAPQPQMLLMPPAEPKNDERFNLILDAGKDLIRRISKLEKPSKSKDYSSIFTPQRSEVKGESIQSQEKVVNPKRANITKNIRAYLKENNLTPSNFKDMSDAERKSAKEEGKKLLEKEKEDKKQQDILTRDEEIQKAVNRAIDATNRAGPKIIQEFRTTSGNVVASTVIGDGNETTTLYGTEKEKKEYLNLIEEQKNVKYKAPLEEIVPEVSIPQPPSLIRQTSKGSMISPNAGILTPSRSQSFTGNLVINNPTGIPVIEIPSSIAKQEILREAVSIPIAPTLESQTEPETSIVPAPAKEKSSKPKKTSKPPLSTMSAVGRPEVKPSKLVPEVVITKQTEEELNTFYENNRKFENFINSKQLYWYDIKDYTKKSILKREWDKLSPSIQEQYDMVGEGSLSSIYPDESLYESEIQKIFKEYNYQFLPVIANNEIHKIKLNKGKPTFFVMNLSDRGESGTHWTSTYINEKGNIYYFDSFGRPPNEETKKGLKDLVGEGNMLRKLKYNTKGVQDPLSSDCGYFSIQFLENMLDGKSFRNSVNITETDLEDEKHHKKEWL
jgi:hypothetical protein